MVPRLDEWLGLGLQQLARVESLVGLLEQLASLLESRLAQPVAEQSTRLLKCACDQRKLPVLRVEPLG